jgi:hypothetical protein
LGRWSKVGEDGGCCIGSESFALTRKAIRMTTPKGDLVLAFF